MNKNPFKFSLGSLGIGLVVGVVYLIVMHQLVPDWNGWLMRIVGGLVVCGTATAVEALRIWRSTD